MRVLPSKTVTERRMFSVDFGDILPWAPTITFARMRVTALSGEDDTPQQVFWKVVSITGTVVTFQVRLGLPGVIYQLKCEVEVGGEWYDRDIKLAILPDFADVSGLYPITATFVSMPYAIQAEPDNLAVGFFPESGELDTVLLEALTEPDDLLLGFFPDSGELFILGNPEFVDDLNVTMIPVSGFLASPPSGTFKDNLNLTFFPTNGVLLNPPIGDVKDNLSITFAPSSGSLNV
jgi:hypothetical protein